MAEEFDKKKIKDNSTFQKKILARFMSDKEMGELMSKYRANFVGGSKDRKEWLLAPLKRDEKIALQKFILEMDKPVRQISKELGIMTSTGLRTKVTNAALKLIFQNQDILNIKGLLKKGGE